MRSFIRYTLSFIFCLGVLFRAEFSFAQTQQEEDKERLLRRNWSLFLEYYKMKDYQAAKKSGWTILELDPKKFQTLHDKMIDIYDTLYSRAAEEGDATMKQAIADTIISLIDDNLRQFPSDKRQMLLRKGYYYERMYDKKSDLAIQAYEEGIQNDYLSIDDYYLNRLAILYAAKPETKMKAITVLQKMLEKDPNNATAQAYLKSLITDPEEYIRLLRDAHYADPSNQQKLFELANAYYETLQNYDSALVYFEKLTKMDPNVKFYWERLGAGYQHQGNYKAAVKAYENLTKIDPDSKEAWLNLAASLLQEGDFIKARTYAEKALSIEKSWGRPHLIIAQCYEASVQKCVETKRGGWDKLKVLDKAVYALAQESYAKAAQDPDAAELARSRSRALDTLTPTAEDMFVNKIKRGSPYLISADCYTWINRSVMLK